MEPIKVKDLSELDEFLAEKKTNLFFDEELNGKVFEIMKKVKIEGDKALLEFTEEFDGVKLEKDDLLVSQDEIEEAYSIVSEDLIESLRLALERITEYHYYDINDSWRYTLEDGTVLGKEVRPVEKVGLYVPGGRANYPSSVLMGAIPARLAGCSDIIICVPPDKQGKVSPAVLVAANEVDVETVFRIGGAQAIAAMAFGTESIPRRNIISGPGNIYVTIAKKLVYGLVGLDMLAGPSEVAILADNEAKADYIAADLLAQAEHSPDATAYLISPDNLIAEKVMEEINKLSDKLSLTGKDIKEQINMVIVPDIETGIAAVNKLAPEHLELLLENPWAILNRIRNAGAIFIGHYSPVAAGDYLAGPNHILPTARTASFASPLGVNTFIKNISLVSLTKTGLDDIKNAALSISEVEGLKIHSQSLKVRG